VTRNNQFKPVVPVRRYSIHPRLLLHGARHDSRHRLPLLRTRASKISTLHDLGLYGLLLCDNLPMVLLGLLPRFLVKWDQRIYWGHETFWIDEYSWGTKSRKSFNTGVAVFVLSDDVLCHHRSYRDRRYCGARKTGAYDGFYLHMGDAGVLPDRILGLEYQRLGVQVWSSRLCRRLVSYFLPTTRTHTNQEQRWTSRDLLWCLGTGI
jgi:hypothetical protein